MKQKLYYPKFISYLFVVFTMNFVHAQEVLSITLGEVLQQCGANNATIKTYEAKVLRAEAQLIKDRNGGFLEYLQEHKPTNSWGSP